jgi:hypothetical protein
VRQVRLTAWRERAAAGVGGRVGRKEVGTLQAGAGLRIGRPVELSYHGLGHTNSDIVVLVDQVLFAGDLIEEGAPPSFGDSYPLDWGPTVGCLELPAVIVPGHGDTVTAEFVERQTTDIATVAELARNGHGQGLPISDLADDGPFPAPTMEVALTRAYSQLNGEL